MQVPHFLILCAIMNIEYQLIVASILVGLIILILRTVVKTTIESSIKHHFNRQIEDIKQEFDERWNVLEQKDKFQLAAIDERLKTAQTAFRLSRLMSATLFDKVKRPGVIQELLDFWDSHSLFLSNKARGAYRSAMLGYANYEALHMMSRETKGDTTAHASANKELYEAFDHIQALPAALENSVDLEAMGETLDSLDGKKITALGENAGDEPQ